MNTDKLAHKLRIFIEADKSIPDDLLLSVFEAEGSFLMELFSLASELKEKWTGKRINFCSIVSAKTGICTEDCAFCGQSSRVLKKNKKINNLCSSDELVKAAEIAKKNGANEFSIVTSGTSVTGKKELETIAKALKRIRDEINIRPCASLGIMKFKELSFLKENGLEIFHHNIETSRDFFPQICSTHSYDDNIRTVLEAKRAGLSVCCGVIIGMGESRLDRIKMAKQIKDLDVNNIPVNFLNPIPGTPLENKKELTPMECLKTLTIFRFINPTKNILAQGGREQNLRQLQPLTLMAGANGLLLGNYLITSGRDPMLDIELIKDMGLEAS